LPYRITLAVEGRSEAFDQYEPRRSEEMKVNAEYFYEEMKDALGVLGVGWGEKEKMEIEFDPEAQTITFSGNGRSLTIPSE
jgi:hypothetical protein